MSETEQLREKVKQLEGQLSSQQRNLRKVEFGTGEKGGVKVKLGTRRFPVTLYAPEWLLLLEHADELKKYIQDHRPSLAWKDGVVD